jgi:succinate-semialdehyde dehydrogenase/glutarate-semialdehyde dehydrogenase
MPEPFSTAGMLRSISPFTGETVAEWRGHSREEILRTADASERAFQSWSLTSMEHRAVLLEHLAALLEADRGRLAALMASEMGKPVSQGTSEVDKCALVCRYYAENSEDFLRDIPVPTEAARSFIQHVPMGVIYAVMPWNFPLWQVFRFAAPAVAAGNGILLKHSPNVTGCALEIAALFREAGFPEGLPGVLLVPAEDAGPVSSMLIRGPVVKAVTLTGSVAAGRALAREAGAALKKCVLELGGSDPAIILEDADLELAARLSVHSRLINAGQNCIASKRFVVAEPVYDRFLERMEAEMGKAVMGDPMDPATTLGPMARPDLRDALHALVTSSLEAGARLVLGGELPGIPGTFYPPTILDRVTPDMPVAEEETFGPAAAVLRARDERDAVRLAGSTRYGLGASVFTADAARGEAIARELRAGACFVNSFVRSDPRFPFGGTGISGYGRELSIQGMLEFVNTKVIWVEDLPRSIGG